MNEPTTRTTALNVIRLAANLPPRPEPTPDLVVSVLTHAIHEIAELGAAHLYTACGLRLPLNAVDPHDELLHHEAHACLACGVSA